MSRTTAFKVGNSHTKALFILSEVRIEAKIRLLNGEAVEINVYSLNKSLI